MIDKTDALMWLDTETTGLDPHKDSLLEIGVTVTTMDGEEIIYQCDHVLYHDTLTVTGDNLAALAMHLKNGLLVACTTPEASEPATATYCSLHKDLTALADVYVLHPAGSNPQFDLEFIDAHAPDIFHKDGHGYWDRIAHYRRFDLTALRLLWQTAGVRYEPGIDTDHRAVTCLLRDLDEYRAMLDQFREAMGWTQAGAES